MSPLCEQQEHYLKKRALLSLSYSLEGQSFHPLEPSFPVSLCKDVYSGSNSASHPYTFLPHLKPGRSVDSTVFSIREDTLTRTHFTIIIASTAHAGTTNSPFSAMDSSTTDAHSQELIFLFFSGGHHRGPLCSMLFRLHSYRPVFGAHRFFSISSEQPGSTLGDDVKENEL